MGILLNGVFAEPQQSRQFSISAWSEPVSGMGSCAPLTRRS